MTAQESTRKLKASSSFESELSHWPDLSDLIQSCIILTYRSHVAHEHASITPFTPGDTFIFGHKMAFVYLVGDSLRLVFKIHYMTESVRGLVSLKFQKAMRTITDRYVDDYVKELCNLIVGKIRGALESKGLVTGMSLPVLARGFDELRYRIAAKPEQRFLYWTLQDRDFQLICSTVAELSRPEAFRQTKVRPAVDAESFEWNEIELF